MHLLKQDYPKPQRATLDHINTRSYMTTAELQAGYILNSCHNTSSEVQNSLLFQSHSSFYTTFQKLN